MYELAFKFVKRLDNATDNDDSIGSEDAMYDEFKDTHRRACLTTSKINLHKFCMALPSNLVFFKGFEMDRPMLSDNCYCYCPCSSKMSKWQKKLKLDLHCSTKKKEFTPVG